LHHDLFKRRTGNYFRNFALFAQLAPPAGGHDTVDENLLVTNAG